MTDLNAMSEYAFAYAKKRQCNRADIDVSVLGMLKRAATELAEATSAFSSCASGVSSDFGRELADAIMCCLIIFGSEKMDAETLLAECNEKNKRRANGVGDKK